MKITDEKAKDNKRHNRFHADAHIAVSLPVSYGFSVLSRRNYYDTTRDYAGIVAHVINGDTVRGYLETGEKDGYYDNTEIFLNSLREEIELTDISVFVPDGDEEIYVWDTEGGEGNCNLGDRTEVFRNYQKYYNTDSAEAGPVEVKPVRTQNGIEPFISVFRSLYDSAGNPAAIVCVTRPELMLGTIISQFTLAILFSAALISSVIMLIVYRLIKKNFIRPIGILTKSAEAMVGNLEHEDAVNIDIHTNDELETLAEAFMKMDVDLREYIQEVSSITSERERISGELDAAAKIQKGILPKRGMQYDDMEEYDLAASMTPAREVGGDFYDIFMTDDRHLALVIADVSGKGVPASLFMVAAKILIKYGMKQGISPAEVFCTDNEKLIESNDMELFVTAWISLIDLDTGECIEVNAGHEHPAIRKKGGEFELIRYKHSPALATLEGLSFRERSFRLEPGDSSPEELLDNVKEAIDEFVDNAPQFDDITMLAFRYNGK